MAFNYTYTHNDGFDNLLIELIQTLSRDSDPQAVLTQLTSVIKTQTQSDRVNLHYVKRTQNGPLVYCWGHDNSNKNVKPFELTQGKGLISWVLTNNDWAIANAYPQRITQVQEIVTGKQGVIDHSPASSKEFNREDNESAMCFMPLPIKAEVGTVVLELTRIKNKRHYKKSDITHLLKATPIIASVCIRVIELEQMAKEQTAIQTIAANIHEKTNTHKADKTLLATLTELTGAFGAITIQYSKSHYYCITSYWANNPEHQLIHQYLTAQFNHFAISDTSFDITNNLAIYNDINDFLIAKSTTLHLMPRLNGLVIKDQNKVVYLVDKVNPSFDINVPANSPKIYNSCLRIINYSNSLFTQYKKAHIRYVIKTLTDKHKQLIEQQGRQSDFEFQLNRLIDSTLKSIKNTCHCDAVLIYLGDLQTIEVKGSMPNIKEHTTIKVGEESFTKQLIEQRHSRLIANVYDSTYKFNDQLNFDDLHALEKAVRIKPIKSWLTCPITLIDEANKVQCYGVIKLVTSVHSPMIGTDTIQIIEAIAQRTYWEYHYLLKQFALFDLNAITKHLAGMKGNLLRNALTQELEHWTQKYVRHNCRIFLYAATDNNKALMICLSNSIAQNLQNTMIEASNAFTKTYPNQIRNEDIYTAIPITLSTMKDVHGHIFFISEQKLNQTEVSLCKEACNEILLLVYQEYLNYKQKEYFAVLRHSLMGPVQGLGSAAQMAIRQAKKLLNSTDSNNKLKNENLKKTDHRIHKELEAIRRWRDISKILGEDTAAIIQPRTNSLNELLDICIKRYQPIAQGRNIIIYDENSNLDRQIVFPFDKAALDIVISNLIDNAVKYAFYNTIIHIKATLNKHFAHIKITDTGHKTPDDNIFAIGKRLDWNDPFRVISGEGYGLAICKSLVEAHGGRIEIKCVAENIELDEMEITKNKATKKYRVSFTVIIPCNKI